MKQLNIGGVPEHFNLPWHLAIEQGMFESAGIKVNWTDYPGGTGAMTKALRSGELDVAVLLTEGIVADIIKGNPSKIVQSYTESPLIWGIYAGGNMPFEDMDRMEGRTYAISRYGSGSHLMAFVDANLRGWDTNNMQFQVVGGMEGAREALKKGEADLFMWEKFMTKPLVDSGEFKILSERETPWPCFAIAARNDVIQQRWLDLERVLLVISKSCLDFMHRMDAASLVAERYKLDVEDAKTWFEGTDWAYTDFVSPEILEEVMNTLLELKIIPHTIDPNDLIHTGRSMLST